MYKTMLQEMCQKRRWNLPEYTTVRDDANRNGRFTATVMVNGETFRSPQAYRSNKEAQNMAASVAHSALTAAEDQPKDGEEIGQQSYELIPKSIVNLYKNKLQRYCHKNNLASPVYKKEIQGPPHAQRFSSTVSVGGKEYRSERFFTTVKDAQQSAAHKACQDLSVDLNQEDSNMYKNLLQELTHKRKIVFPTYETTPSGQFHNLFASIVEVDGRKFKGPEARSKKQAEIMAAKVAYLALTKGKELNMQTTMGWASASVSGKSMSGYYQLQGPVDAHPVEIIPGGRSSTTLIVHSDLTYQIPTGTVIKTCNDEWVAIEIIGKGVS